ncbi:MULTISPECIES: PEP-CTERM sorting domain-containing protein [unclassified Janthinobacterium]|uniref:PEP-CTERM sorting domain-containing protein n=1 Tax=unclassified Janthinobacterium TaxID=2610881 RepID=UPI00037E193A|nr:MULTISPECIES: PEP-CTERM sorting domain-containing protein [unclassified Janthinobacterium]MEC5162392.1 hypothetical protein [Janthinobacterium sp. CG_S6]
MLNKKNAASAALLTLAMSVMSASAQAAGVNYASASISDFSYQLIDLNPIDGIAASLTFTAFSSTSKSDHWYHGGGEVNTLSGFGSTKAEGIGGASNTTVTQFGVASESRSTAVPLEFEFNMSYSSTSYIQRFTLSANTLVIFSGTANHFTGYVPELYSSSGATTKLIGREIGARWPHIPGFSSSLITKEAGPENMVLLGSMQSFGATMFGEVEMSASTVTRRITPVPEPETYAMLLAGLGLVAGALRRKRRGAR